MKILQILKNRFELDKPKCPHFKLYRLPHNVLVCPECFRCFDMGSMMLSRIALDDKDLEKLFEIKVLCHLRDTISPVFSRDMEKELQSQGGYSVE